MGKIRASAMHAQANTTEHGASWILCIASSYALFFSYFDVLRKVNGRCRYFCEVMIVHCLPSTLLENSTLSPFFLKADKQWDKHNASSLSRINRLISFFTVKLLSAALLLFFYAEWQQRSFPIPSLFSLRSCPSDFLSLSLHFSMLCLVCYIWKYFFGQINFLLLTTESSIRQGFQKGV